MKRITIRWSCILLLLALLICSNSCALRISAEELSKPYSRTASEEGEVTEAFKTAMAEFSFRLLKGVLTEDDQNDLVSPLSAVLCLAMLANGADGNTKTQMEEALGMDVDALNQALYAYTSSLYTADDCKIGIADSIWLRDTENRLHVKEEFLQANADWYAAQVYASPFDTGTLKDLNAWVKKHTDGMIDKILDEIPSMAVMILVNALSFDAKWKTVFEKADVYEETFRNFDGSETELDFLHSDEYVYLTDGSAKAFAKPYAGNKYSFVGILPGEGTDVYSYLDSLDGEGWMNLWNSRTATAVKVMFPEFSYDTSMNLNETLQAMGMTDLFSEDDANLTKLGYSELGNLYCSEVGQKTHIEVDANGTKAAAVTWSMVNSAECALEEAPLTVYLTSSFVYAIVDNASGLPLFLGTVTNL